MPDSHSELNGTSEYEVNFDSNDSDIDNIHAAVYNVGKVKQVRKFTDFFLENVLFIILTPVYDFYIDYVIYKRVVARRMRLMRRFSLFCLLNK